MSEKIQLIPGQKIADIDTNNCFHSEQPGSGYCFQLDLSGYAVVNGQQVGTHFIGSNTGSDETFESLAKHITRLLKPYHVTRDMVIEPDDFDTEDDDRSTKELFVSYIAQQLQSGGVFELVFNGEKLELVCTDDSNFGNNYTSEEELEEETDEDDEDDIFED